MTMQYEQFFPIRPISKIRPRHGKGNTFTPKRSREFEDAIRGAYRGPTFHGPIEMKVWMNIEGFYVAMSNLSGDVDRGGLTGDVDNYAKSVLDGLQPAKGMPLMSEAYRDDKDITRLGVQFAPKGFDWQAFREARSS